MFVCPAVNLAFTSQIFYLANEPPIRCQGTRSNDSLDKHLNKIYIVDIMAKGTFLGEFEHIVLLTLLRLGDGSHGAMIRGEIEATTGRSPSIGALHATLERLERKGLVSSWMGEPTAERGGKAKRQFTIEAAGIEALKQARTVLDRLHAGISLRAHFA